MPKLRINLLEPIAGLQRKKETLPQNQLSKTGRIILEYFPKLEEYQGVHPDFEGEEQRRREKEGNFQLKVENKPILVGANYGGGTRGFSSFHFTGSLKHYDFRRLFEELTQGRVLEDSGSKTHVELESKTQHLKTALNNRHYYIEIFAAKRKRKDSMPGLSIRINPTKDRGGIPLGEINTSELMPGLVTIDLRNSGKNAGHMTHLVNYLFSKSLLTRH